MLRLTPQELTLDAAAPGELPRRTLAGVALTYGETATVSDGQKVRFEAGSLPLEGKKPKMYLYHDSARPVGVVTARELVGNSVMFEAKISDTTEGNEALVLASDGVLDAVSVGVVPVDFAYEADGTMVVKAAVWEELSLVPYGAFKSAVVEKVAATIPQTDDVLGNNEQEDPQEKDHEMEQPVETPAVIEAAAIAPVYAQPRSFKLPSPAEYIAAMVDGGSRWAVMNERIKAAAPDITTSDTPGILPESIVGSPYDGLDPIRPFVSAIGVRAMPGAGSTFRRPKITVRPTVTEQPTGQLNPLDPSTVTVANFDITKKTFGTYVTMSEQDLDWSDPASLNIVLNQLAIAYGQATDNYAVDTMVSGVTQTETVTDLTDPEAVIGAIYGAAYQISNGSNYLPTHYFVSPVTWAKLGMLTTTTGAPVFPYVGAPNLIGQNALGTSSATSWNGNPLGLVLVVDKNMAGGTTTGTLSGVIGHAAGPAAGFEFYEQQKGAISVDVPSILGRTISWRGYAAAFMADATKFVKLVNA
jgi:TfoX/Sxy family transcriptional regulator of competence genes